MKQTITIATAAFCAACAGGGAGPVATPPAPEAAATVMRQAAQAEAPKPKDIDPIGGYTVSLTYGGQPVNVLLEIAKRPDGTLGGTISADQTPPIPLASVSVTGKRVQVTLTTPDGASATIDFTIEGAELTGAWKASSGDGSPISGRKLP